MVTPHNQSDMVVSARSGMCVGIQERETESDFCYDWQAYGGKLKTRVEDIKKTTWKKIIIDGDLI